MPSHLANAHIAQERRLRLATEDAIRRVWQRLPHYDRANLDQFLSLAVPLVEASQKQSIALTDTYIARVMGRSPLGLDADSLIPTLRTGATTEDVYKRPFVDVWSGLKNGTAWESAVEAGLDRAMSSAAMDVQLAMRGAASEAFTADDRVYGYERVPDGNACDLCMVASTQRYYNEDLLPIHNRCGCGVSPITEPVGRVINEERYGALSRDGTIDRVDASQQASRLETRALQNRAKAEQIRDELNGETDIDRRERLAVRAQNWDYRAQSQENAAAAARVRANGTTAEVRNHGELGPVLTDGSHDFTLL